VIPTVGLVVSDPVRVTVIAAVWGVLSASVPVIVMLFAPTFSGIPVAAAVGSFNRKSSRRSVVRVDLPLPGRNAPNPTPTRFDPAQAASVNVATEMPLR
jgi:hypothetical protein